MSSPSPERRGRRSSRIAPDREDSSFFTPSPMHHHDSGRKLHIHDHLSQHMDELAIDTTDDLEPGAAEFVSESTTTDTYIPPWTEPYIIGIAGNSGSGKTSISQKIIHELNQPWTVLLSFDNFYKPLQPEESIKAFNNEWDFDTPASLDLDLLVETVKNLKRGRKTEIPVYSFAKHARTDKKTTIYGANVIIIEGIYALYDQRLLDLMDIKIYVDTDLDICLARRLTRDILYRGRDLGGAMKQWETFVKPNAVRYVNPTMNNADLIIPRGLDNLTAINLMIKHIQKQLSIKLALHLKHLKTLGMSQEFKVENYASNVTILPDNNHTRGIHSILFSESTERSDFIFYFDRISNLIIENAIEQMNNYEQVSITTGSNHIFKGLKSTEEVIAVNVIRSGDCFMNSIKKTFPEISIGKLLIQSDSRTGEPQLHTESLPRSLHLQVPHKKIFLFDAQIISGAAAIMAIQVLIDHKVKACDIVLCCYLCTEIGLRRILNVFADVNVVIGKLSEVDEDDDNNECDKLQNKVEQQSKKWYNAEGFKDTDWHFRTRFIDSLYFGTE